MVGVFANQHYFFLLGIVALFDAEQGLVDHVGDFTKMLIKAVNKTNR